MGVSKKYKGPHKHAIEKCFFKKKNWSKGRKKLVGAVSGIAGCRGQCQEENIDYEGNDAESVGDVKTWNACADLCSKKDTCFAWTWVSKKYKGPHKHAIEKCFFKD